MVPHRVNPTKRGGCGGGNSFDGCCGNKVDEFEFPCVGCDCTEVKRAVVKMILIQILKMLMTLGPHVRDIQLGQIQSASLLLEMTTIAKLSGP